MPYYIMQFHHPKKHREGQISRDLRQIGGGYSNLYKAEVALYNLMNNHRIKSYLRIDRNISPNPVVFADLDENGGIVRFKKRDGIHWTIAITLSEFRQHLIRSRPTPQS